MGDVLRRRRKNRFGMRIVNTVDSIVEANEANDERKSYIVIQLEFPAHIFQSLFEEKSTCGKMFNARASWKRSEDMKCFFMI